MLKEMKQGPATTEALVAVQGGQRKSKARQALLVWVLFFAATFTINLLIPFFFGFDLHDWSFSNAKRLLVFSLDYAGFFLIVPWMLTKGWGVFKKPSFMVPVAAAAISVVIWSSFAYVAVIALAVYAYLHWRFDLSELGLRTKGWKGDAVAILLVGSLGLLQALAASSMLQLAVLPAFYSVLFRMFGNPASTVENLFYYGFLTERLGNQWSRYLVPFVVGTLYTAHEMSNPAYWYQGVNFPFIFIGVTVFAAVYMWRRNIIVIWLSDGFRWFFSML
jgi:hypothetical protein